MLVDEEVSSLLNRALMTRLIYKATLAVLLVTTSSMALAYVLPSTFIGRVLGERGLNTRFEALEFSIRSEKDPKAIYSVKVSKQGQLELIEGERFADGQTGKAKLEFAGEKLEISGDFKAFPGSPALWSGFLLLVLDAEDADAVEARWNAIAEVLGLKDPQSDLERCRETICYAISSKTDEKPSAQLLVRGRLSGRSMDTSSRTTHRGQTNDETLGLPEFPAPKWVPHYLEFDASNAVTERFEVLDVQFHQPSETQTHRLHRTHVFSARNPKFIFSILSWRSERS